MINSSKLLVLVFVLTALCIAYQPVQAAQGTQAAESNGQPQAVAPPFTLAVSAVKDEIQAGSPVELKVVTTNTSTHDVIFVWPVSYHALLAYSYDILDGNGNVPPDTQLRRMYRYAAEDSPNIGRGTILTGSLVDLSLKPGQSHTDVVDVGALYDFSNPGAYTIQVQRIAWQDKTGVKSNPITVNVVPAVTAQPTPSTAEASASQPSFSLTIRLESNVTSSIQGSPNELVIITKNTSDHRILLRTEKGVREQAGSVYKVDVNDSTGASPRATEFGRLTKIREDAPPLLASTSTPRQGGESLSLKPGEDWWDTIRLHRLYTLNKPGQYTIQVRRWDDETKTWVKSNTVTLTVTP